MQNYMNTINYDLQIWYETDASNVVQGYTNNVFPTDLLSIKILAVNYYDHYNFDRSVDGSADYSYTSSHLAGELPTAASTRTRGLATGSKKAMIASDGTIDNANWLINVVFYDEYDRPIQGKSNNHQTPAVSDITSMVYTLKRMQKVKTTHTGTNGTTVVNVVQRYTYDHAGRTTAIFHSINGATEQQLVAYQYNALGQLVDKKLHNTGGSNFMQSVDMRYNIRGWLTSINNSTLDVNANTNDETNDYFGMELNYQTAAGMSNILYYNGNISAVKWKGIGVGTAAADQRSYKYTYDKSDKLKAATFQAHNGTGWTKEAGTLDENMAYDANGNVLTLARKQNQRGLSGTTITSAPQLIDNLTYTHATGNQLSKVEDAVATTIGSGDFKNGSTATTEYTYNSTGSITSDLNKGISSITYNALGKPQLITYSGTPVKTIAYTYDAAGTKIKTVTTVNGVTTTTDYVGPFVYTNNVLSFFSSPEGRVVKNGSTYEYQYALTDHQGNTRLIFSSATPTALTKTATFEGDANDNGNEFLNVSNVVPSGSANHTSGGLNVVRMNQTYKVGPAKSLKVYPGDKVDMEVWSYYENASGYGSTNNTATTMITAIATAFGGVSGALGETGLIYNGVNSAIAGFGLGANPGDTQPSAFLNYILFDQQYNVVTMGWKRVAGGAFTKQIDSLSNIKVKEAGYIFIYLSYEDLSNNYVYFDDFKVTHTKNNIVQYNEYYPFGMQTTNSWTRENNTGNNFLANGGTELNNTSQLYDLDYRNYDPILGRMTQVDPMASKYASYTPYNFSFNDPITFNDPTGADPLYDETTRATFGEVMQGGYYKPHVMDTGVFGAPYSSGSDVTITNPGFFSASAWAQIGSTINTLFNNTNPYNGQGVWSLTEGSFSFFSGGQYTGGGSVRPIYGVTFSITKSTTATMWAKYTSGGIIGYRYTEQQQTQGGDPTLEAFRSKYFGGVTGLGNIYGSAPAGYDLVNGAFVKQGDPDKKPVSGVTNYLGRGKSDVYIAPNSMTTNKELFLVMGHEFVHVYHYTVFGYSLNLGFSENAAYQWSIDAAVVNSWDYYSNIYSKIQKNDWPNSNASYDYLLSGINLMFPK